MKPTIMKGCVLVCLTVIYLCGTINAKSANEWKGRIIYQLLTDRFAQSASDPQTPCSDLQGWCGGTFKGIQRRLDYIKQLGANAIWISPIVLNTEGGYHGYWAKDLTQIEGHFGTEQDLKDLVDECHRNDIWVMVDVVPNHMGYPQGCNWNPCDPGKLCNFTGYIPFNLPEHYHTLCFINFSNPDQRQIEVCRLANLPDLNQTFPYVRQTLKSWISNLTLRYGFDGYRVDTTRHIAKDFWPEFQNAAGVFLTGEVAVQDNPAYVADYQNYMDSVLNYPMYSTLRGVFNNGESMTVLRDDLAQQKQLFKDVTVLGLFAENHDQPRFLSLTKDVSLYKNVLVYIALGEGIPIIYYGTEQLFNGGGDPNNRESLWPRGDPSSTMFGYVQNLTSFRKQRGYFVDQPVDVLQVMDKSFVFSRGVQHEILVFMSNFGQGKVVEIKLKDAELGNIKDGAEYTDIFSSAKLNVVQCQLKVVLTNGEPIVLKKTSEGAGKPCDTLTYSHSGASSMFKFGLI